MKVMSDLNSLFFQNWCCLIKFNLWINVILWLLTFMICQEMTNYKEERIVMKNLIYIIFVVLYTISLLDFVIFIMCLIYQIWFWFQLYMYITFIFTFCSTHMCCSICSFYIDFAHLFVCSFSMHSSLFSLSSHLVVFTMYVFVA